MKITLLIVTLMLSLSSFGKTVLFLGDSLTEGYELAKEDAYPFLVEEKLKKKHPNFKGVNGGVSGATSASGLTRLNWYFKVKPDIMVLALGANDGLRGLDLKVTEKNISSIIEKAKEKNVQVVLAGMLIPTNYGEEYRNKFEKLFIQISKKYKIPLIPFLLEGVAGKANLNLPDGIHPNSKGHEIMAETMIKHLEPLL